MLFAEADEPATPLAPTTSHNNQHHIHALIATPQKKSGVRITTPPSLLPLHEQSTNTTDGYATPNERRDGDQFSRMLLEFSDSTTIGRGSFGEVHKAVYDQDKQTYAIKVSSKAIGGSTDLQQRLQEVYAASVCSHPHLVKYYDCWVDDNKLHIRLEYANGGSINDAKTYPTPWTEGMLSRLLLQIGLALQWLHSSGIAHLDIKPDNILMAHSSVSPGQCMFKLGDLGLARRVFNPAADPSAQPVMLGGENDDEGDHRYLCPRILESGGRGGQCWNKEADMFSLGATVVQLMGGDPARAKLGDYGHNINNRAMYSDTLASLVKQLCDVTPVNRPSALQIVETSLKLMCDDVKPAEVPASDVVGDVERRCRSRRRMLEELHAKAEALERDIAAFESSEQSPAHA